MLPCKDFVKFVVSTEETKVKLAIFLACRRVHWDLRLVLSFFSGPLLNLTNMKHVSDKFTKCNVIVSLYSNVQFWFNYSSLS